MSSLKKIGHMLACIAGLLFFISPVALAQDASNQTTTSSASAAGTSTTPTPSTRIVQTQSQELRKDYGDGVDTKTVRTQNFPLHGAAQLGIQFRYLGEAPKLQLKEIMFHNTGTPLELKILSQDQVLGSDDFWVLPVPNVAQLVLHVQAYDPNVSDRVKDLYKGKTYIFSRGENGRWFLHSKF